MSSTRKRAILVRLAKKDYLQLKHHYRLAVSLRYGVMTSVLLDYAVTDEEGYFYILGRTDDVINVAGHRIGTQEIEEAISTHPEMAECAVVGIQDELKGELPIAFCVLKDQTQIETTENRFRIEQQVIGAVVKSLGGIARPAAIYFPQALPKTRSGKILRRSIRALAENQPTGDMSTLDNPTAIDAIKQAMKDY